MRAKSRFLRSMKVRPPDLPGPLGGFRGVLVATVLAVFVVAWAATDLGGGGRGSRGASRAKGGGGGGRPRVWLAPSPPRCPGCFWLPP